MDIENLEFISIGGCCLDLYILGPDRIRGPIDNVLLFSWKVVKFLFDNTYIKYITTTPYIKQPKKVIKSGEPPINFLFKTKLKIIHNDFEDPKYLNNIQKRMDNFKQFVNQLKIDANKYLVFSIPYTFVEKGNEIDSRLERLIQYLKEKNLLSKTIFVGAHKPSYINKTVWWDNYLNKKTYLYLYNKYKINYINLKNIDLRDEAGKTAAYLIFKKQTELLFNRKD